MNKSFDNFLTSIKNKNITILGIGISNTPVISMLVNAGAIVTARDKKTKDKLGDVANELESLGVKLVLGEDYLENISGDYIIKTPGIRFDTPQLVKAKQNGSIITSEMELFFDYCPCPIIAITGSDGKTTTTSLVYEMLKKAGYTVHLGGNIGMPLLPRIKGISEKDITVVELSSFQLHTMKKSAQVSVVTNLSPNHLDWHTGMDEYIDSKTNIFKFQSQNETLVVNFNNEITNSFKANGKLKKFAYGRKPDSDGAYFENDTLYLYKDGKSTEIIKRSDIKIRGDHNVENYLAAIVATEDFCSAEDVEWVARNFSGVRHRIEFAGEKNGVKFYNDSIGSSPTRTIATLRSFDDKVILIAGGYDKKIPFDTLADEIPKKVKKLVLTGKTADLIYKALLKNPEFDKELLPVELVDGFENAVRKAASLAQKGDDVLLSPACASFDEFKNFEERGDKFIEIVNSL